MKQSIIFRVVVAGLFLVVFPGAKAQKPEAYDMMVNGVKVIVQPTIDEIVEFRTIIKGGVQNYKADKAGIESLAIKALTECGTVNDDKNSFKNKLDKVSARISGGTGADMASFNLNCIKGDLNTIWSLYVDAFTAPRFDEKEFERIRQDQINIIKSQESNPDFAIWQMAKEVAFAGKNYALNPLGREASVKALTAAETKEYFKSIANKKQVFIVVVGNLEKATIEKMAGDIISKLPEGGTFQFEKYSYAPKSNTFKSEKRDLATNYVQGLTGGPAPGTKEYNAFMLAMNIMYDRHFLEIRTNNGLSYAPSSYFNGNMASYAIFSASTTDPNKYIQVVNKLIDKTKTKGFTEEEVRNMKTSFITDLFYNQETNGAQAGALASNEVLHNNWRRAITINEDLKSITPKDVSTVFNKYVNNLTWVYQGDPTKVDPNLYTGIKKADNKLPPSTFSNKKVN